MAVIVVAHNQADHVDACLRALGQHLGGSRVEVFVVDTGSSDDLASVADAHRAKFVPGPNRGFAEANNRALRRISPSSRHVLMLNPDTEWRHGTLRKLVGFSDQLAWAGAVTGRTEDQHGSLVPNLDSFPNCRLEWTKALGRPAPMRQPLVYSSDARADWAIGAFLLIRRSVIEELGGFDERFFLYYEEVDFCRRMRELTLSVAYTPSVGVMHRTADRVAAPWRERLRWSSRRRYDNKWLSLSERLCCRFALVVRWTRGLHRSTSDERKLALFRIWGTLGPAPYPGLPEPMNRSSGPEYGRSNI